MYVLTLEASRKKELHVHKHLKGGGSIRPPSTFDTIHPIDMIYDIYKLSLYFQLTLFRLGFFGRPWTGRGGGVKRPLSIS